MHCGQGPWDRDLSSMSDMVFQGVVTGPSVWNPFYENACSALNECVSTEVDAEDLIACGRVHLLMASSGSIAVRWITLAHRLRAQALTWTFCFSRKKTATGRARARVGPVGPARAGPHGSHGPTFGIDGFTPWTPDGGPGIRKSVNRHFAKNKIEYFVFVTI